MTRLKMMFITLFPLLLWVALVVAQTSDPNTFRTKRLPVQPPTLDRYTSQGCFSELPSQFTFFRRTNMAPNWCYRQCKGRQYSVMLMNDDKCYCSDKYPTERSLLPEERCLLPFRTSLRARSTSGFLKSCTTLCRIKRKPVAMIHGSECHCATTYPPTAALVNDDSCGIPCRGSTDHVCGGHSFMYTAYLTGLSQKVKHQVGTVDGPSEKSPFMELTLVRITYHGCYSSRPREFTRRPKGRESTNTATSCPRYCRRMGKPVALMYDQSCSCSDTYPKRSSRVKDRECDIPCPGYPPRACGGHEALLSVMNTGLQSLVADDKEDHELPKLPLYGCFSDTPASFKTIDHRSFNRETQGDSCTYACAASGYPVALRQGGDCHCSRSYPPPSSRVNETQCRFECPFDAREMCGGPLMYNVYRTRLDWAVDDELEDLSTSAVTRPWKCSHPVIQQVKKTASWVMSEAMVIVYHIAWALYEVFWEVKRLFINIISPLRWIWDGISEVMDL
ncbi:hypothetical protein B0J15DRAFT_565739 [Fusarium solani]|uniref:WSC domain-containing protein n=1 Tax=Fusarium solani TaxID=169388 RepID=A0A9P9GRL3_FUSSL|nr:uncharacterized protein B0J15DRAFT_565739 [Fusarium solani]KAH7242872.1 hypothetical protein B0J15DRAFT_565739 [Fusarium solani]